MAGSLLGAGDRPSKPARWSASSARKEMGRVEHEPSRHQAPHACDHRGQHDEMERPALQATTTDRIAYNDMRGREDQHGHARQRPDASALQDTETERAARQE